LRWFDTIPRRTAPEGHTSISCTASLPVTVPTNGSSPCSRHNNAEILNQRTRIGELLGQIRDLQAEWTEEAIQRITTENTTLKQRVRQLTADNRTLEERLTAARSNLRFQDRRVADLEAKLVDLTTLT
jgi:predicted RNase H-like nuclease (RuvC/YqgF family)